MRGLMDLETRVGYYIQRSSCGKIRRTYPACGSTNCHNLQGAPSSVSSVSPGRHSALVSADSLATIGVDLHSGLHIVLPTPQTSSGHSSLRARFPSPPFNFFYFFLTILLRLYVLLSNGCGHGIPDTQTGRRAIRSRAHWIPSGTLH